jgi:uncharacterized protein YjiS (DUF1127 family)
MTYPAENFYPGFDVPRSPRRRTGLIALATTLVDAVRKAVAHYNTFRRERATVRQLSMLDDATLRDIGLDRGQIPAAARAAALTQPPKAQQ